MRACTLFATCSLLFAQEPDARLVRVASGLTLPVDIQHAGDGTGRLFLVQQNGIIRVWRDGSLLTAPLLDISARTRGNGECGLLGLAFPPGFKDKQYFYVNYTDPQCRVTTVSRFRISSGNPNAAEAGSEAVILTQAQPFQNHNGGGVVFGPDGYLYIGFGDGGSARDPQNAGQNRRTWLGKMLRIDVETGVTPYRVPADNPFVNDPAFLPEIWAWGLRNPWRFSFDPATGDLWIGDVGQNRAEEINFQPAGQGGQNYGWRLMEGLQCLDGGCDRTGLVLPIHEYTRQQGDVSVTGGNVYHGSLAPALRGSYVYGDYQSGRIWVMRRQGDGISNRLLFQSPYRISSFGVDEAGELYLAHHTGGEIYRFVGPARPSLNSQSVVNAASFVPGLVPGSLATVYTTNITAGPGIAAAPRLPLATSMNGVTVSVGGRNAPILAVANAGGAEQVNFQVPWEVAGESAEVVVRRDGDASDPVRIPVLAVQPGVFAANGLAIVVRSADNTLVAAGSGLRGGEGAYVYVTGLGGVTNQPASGAAAPRDPLAQTRAQVTVTLGGAPCEVLFAGLAPDLAGVYQVNFRAPATLSTANADLVVTAGNVSSRPARVAIQ